MEEIKSLASTRERRPNAGVNMSRLLDKEEEDEFYQTQYGGFLEVENDNDFFMSDSSDSENVIDSDFDIDENQETAAAGDDDAEEKAIQQEEKLERKAEAKRRTAYREPALPKAAPKRAPVRRAALTSMAGPSSTKKFLRSDDGSLYQNLRESTKKISRVTKENLEDERRRKLRSKNKFKRKSYREPTQEERLRAAKQTEIENMRSLEAYKNLEIEKSKKNKLTKKMPNVPLIRYHSYTHQVSKQDNPDMVLGEPCYRTIISFPNDELFEKCFGRFLKPPVRRDWPRKRATSVLSSLPVRYKDPLTEFPFAKAKEFSVIRDAYVRYLEQCSFKDDPVIKKFIESNQLLHSIKVKISNNKVPAGAANSTNTTGLYSGTVPGNSIEYQDCYTYRTLKTVLPRQSCSPTVVPVVHTKGSAAETQPAARKKPVSFIVITTPSNKPQQPVSSTTASTSTVDTSEGPETSTNTQDNHNKMSG